MWYIPTTWYQVVCLLVYVRLQVEQWWYLSCRYMYDVGVIRAFVSRINESLKTYKMMFIRVATRQTSLKT
jgi:hypothetical protein